MNEVKLHIESLDRHGQPSGIAFDAHRKRYCPLDEATGHESYSGLTQAARLYGLEEGIDYVVGVTRR